jgi:hypothetical protein
MELPTLPPAHMPHSCKRVRQIVGKNILYIEIFMPLPPILCMPHAVHAFCTYTLCLITSNWCHLGHADLLQAGQYIGPNHTKRGWCAPKRVVSESPPLSLSLRKSCQLSQSCIKWNWVICEYLVFRLLHFSIFHSLIILILLLWLGWLPTFLHAPTRKNQLFLFHLTISYYILLLLFWG